jgi:hypothetical protein
VGRGNLVRRADEIRTLGAKAAKKLPARLLEITDDSPVDAAEDVEPAADSAPDADAGTELGPDSDRPLRH